jgi:hypothetical protein
LAEDQGKRRHPPYATTAQIAARGAPASGLSTESVRPDDFIWLDVLSAVIAVLMFAESLGGLLLHDLYRDNTWSRESFRGTDLATLVFAVPVLIVSLVLARRGSARARLVWLGAITYAIYNYAFYLFGTVFNDLFLLYAVLLFLSIFTLVVAWPRVRRVGRLADRAPVRTISVYTILVGVMFGLLWVIASIQFIVTDEVPQVIVDSGIHTSIVFALDLTLVVPAFIAGGLLLWRRRPVGLVLVAVMNVLGVLYMVALGFTGAYQANAGIKGASWSAPPYAELAVTSLIAAWLLLRRTEQADDSRR